MVLLSCPLTLGGAVLTAMLSDSSLSARSKLQRNEDRDISEQIALGIPSQRPTGEIQYDQRLFNQSRVRALGAAVTWALYHQYCEAPPGVGEGQIWDFLGFPWFSNRSGAVCDRLLGSGDK